MGQINADVHKLMAYVRNLNDALRLSHHDRDLVSQKHMHDVVLGREINLANEQSQSPLYSSEGSVYLQGSLCVDLFQVLEKRSLESYVVAPGADLIEVQHNLGTLGCSLYVSTKEMQYALRFEFYSNPFFIGQAGSLLAELNLALSVLLTDHLVLKAKQEFMVSIGKIALRDSQAQS